MKYHKLTLQICITHTHTHREFIGFSFSGFVFFFHFYEIIHYGWTNEKCVCVCVWCKFADQL